jgi:adenylosuccinate lyase
MEQINIHSKIFKTLIESIDEVFMLIENEENKREQKIKELQTDYYELCKTTDARTAQLNQRINKAMYGEFILDTVSALLLKKILEIKTKSEIDNFINNLMEAQNDIN